MTTIDMDEFQELLLTELPRLLRQRPEFRYKVQAIVLEASPSRADFRQLLQEIKELREESNRRFEEQVVEMQALRADSNRRFESSERRYEEQAAETRAWREKQIAEMQALRADSNRRMDEGFKEVQKSIDRLGQRWGIHNESIFRQTIAALLEESFGSKVESRRIDGEQYDVVILNGEHILVEITASAGPKTQKPLERKRRIYTDTVQAPVRVILAAASIHSRRARALEEAGFEVIEPEEEDTS